MFETVESRCLEIFNQAMLKRKFLSNLDEERGEKNVSVTKIHISINRFLILQSMFSVGQVHLVQ